MIEYTELLRKKIEQEVFTTREEERFIPEGSLWIMDFRRIFMQADVLDAYAEIFYQRFERDWPFQVGGAEVSAIPLVTAIALKMREKGKPVNAFFVRKSRKKTGLLKMVEGVIIADTPVILVDDLINRGSTFERQVLVAEEAGATVKALFTTLRFRTPEYYKRFHTKGIRIESLFSLDDFHASLGTTLRDRNGPSSLPIVFDVRWRFRGRQPLLEFVARKSGVAWDDEYVYFGTDNGTLYALDHSDGNVVWRYDLWPAPDRTRVRSGKQIFSTPVIAGERVYFGAYDGNVYCLDRKTGKRKWVSFEADWIDGDIRSWPEQRQLLVPACFGLAARAGGVIALDIQTGKKVWEKRFPSMVTGGLVLSSDGSILFVPQRDGTLSALSLKTKEVVWSFRSLGAINNSPVIDEAGVSLVFSSMDGSVYCLDAKTGKLRWRFENGLANYSSPFVQGSRIYFASLDKHVYGIDLTTGKKLWEFATRARIFSSPRIYGNKLYIGGNDACLHELDPETGRETGSLQITERITQPLQYDDRSDQYYLITYANEVYALRRPLAK